MADAADVTEVSVDRNESSEMTTRKWALHNCYC